MKVSTAPTETPVLAIKATLGTGPDKVTVGWISTDPGWWCSQHPKGRCACIRTVREATWQVAR